MKAAAYPFTSDPFVGKDVDKIPSNVCPLSPTFGLIGKPSAPGEEGTDPHTHVSLCETATRDHTLAQRLPEAS